MNYDTLERQLADAIKTNTIKGANFRSLDPSIFSTVALNLTSGAADYRAFVYAKPLFDTYPAQDVLAALSAHFYRNYHAHRPLMEFLHKAQRELPASISPVAQAAIESAQKTLALSGEPCAAEGLAWLSTIKGSNLKAEHAAEVEAVREYGISATYSDDYTVRSREGLEARMRDDALELIKPVFESIGFDYVPRQAPRMEIGMVNFSLLGMPGLADADSTPKNSLDRLSQTLLKFGGELQAEHNKFSDKIAKVVDHDTPTYGWGPRGNIFYAQAKELFLSIDREDLRSLKVELMEIKNNTLESIRDYSVTPGVSRSIQTQEVMASYQQFLKVFDRAHADYHAGVQKPAPASSLTAGM